MSENKPTVGAYLLAKEIHAKHWQDAPWYAEDRMAEDAAQLIDEYVAVRIGLCIDALRMGLSAAERELEDARRRSVEPTVHAKLRGRVEAWENAIKHIGGKVEHATPKP